MVLPIIAVDYPSAMRMPDLTGCGKQHARDGSRFGDARNLQNEDPLQTAAHLLLAAHNGSLVWVYAFVAEDIRKSGPGLRPTPAPHKRRPPLIYS